ncbi:hypothetical protein CYMTET_10904, partial [Cymbomonas tetramitiformis]
MNESESESEPSADNILNVDAGKTGGVALERNTFPVDEDNVVCWDASDAQSRKLEEDLIDDAVPDVRQEYCSRVSVEETCPVCGKSLSQVADTVRAMEAHVNECLEASSDPNECEEVRTELSSPPSPQPRRAGRPTAGEREDAPPSADLLSVAQLLTSLQ